MSSYTALISGSFRLLGGGGGGGHHFFFLYALNHPCMQDMEKTQLTY